MTRKEKAKLHNDLMEILTDCEDDTDFFNRLVYALEIIAGALSRWEKK